MIVSLFGMSIRVRNQIYTVYAAVWLILTLFAVIVLDLSLIKALVGALVCVIFHIAALMVHHLGHFYAGKSVGYPMSHMVMWGLLGTDRYPKDEPPLSAAIHRRRAIGGPLANLLLSIPVALLVVLLYPESKLEVQWVLVFCLVNTFIIFMLGSFAPLKWMGIETDGDVLLKYWGQA